MVDRSAPGDWCVSADGNLKNAMLSVKRFALCVALAERLAGHPCDFGRPVAAGIIIENLAGDRAFVCWVESVDV